jgi:NADH-ubiquinone oxidoreductase chain 5
MNFWDGALFIKSEEWTLFEAEYLEDWIKDIPLLFGFIGGLTASYLYSEEMFSSNVFKWKISKVGRNIYSFLNRKWFFDKVYNEWVGQTILDLAYKHTYQNIDRGIVEFLGPHGIGTKVYKYTLAINQVTMDFLYRYILMLLVFITTFLFIFMYWPLFVVILDIRLLLICFFAFVLIK